jgi:hypothetical protein
MTHKRHPRDSHVVQCFPFLPTVSPSLPPSLPPHLRQLGVREGKRPQPEVGRGVGDHAQDELDRLDHLVDHDLANAA